MTHDSLASDHLADQLQHALDTGEVFDVTDPVTAGLLASAMRRLAARGTTPLWPGFTELLGALDNASGVAKVKDV